MFSVVRGGGPFLPRQFESSSMERVLGGEPGACVCPLGRFSRANSNRVQWSVHSAVSPVRVCVSARLFLPRQFESSSMERVLGGEPGACVCPLGCFSRANSNRVQWSVCSAVSPVRVCVR